MVVKNDGRREVFKREKILNGIIRACDKRDISLESITSLTNDIAAVDKSSRPGTWYMSFVSNKAGVSHGAVRGDGFAVRLVVLADEE